MNPRPLGKVRHHIHFGSLVTLALLSIGCGAEHQRVVSQAKNPPANRVYGRFVSLGFRRIEVDGVCALFNASLSSDNFFEGLRVARDSDSLHVSKENAQIKFFPDLLYVGISGALVKCSIGPGLPPLIVTDKLRQSLKFDAYWKTGQELRRVSGLAVDTVNPQWRESEFIWAYEITFVGSDVPIDATLIIQVRNADGLLIAEFSGQL